MREQTDADTAFVLEVAEFAFPSDPRFQCYLQVSQCLLDLSLQHKARGRSLVLSTSAYLQVLISGESMKGKRSLYQALFAACFFLLMLLLWPGKAEVYVSPTDGGRKRVKSLILYGSFH